MDFTTGLLVATFIVVIFYWLTKKKNSNLPPGPYGLPLVGYLPFLSSKPYLDFQKLAKRYGPVFRMRLGRTDVIVLSDYYANKTALSQDVFIGRPEVDTFRQTKETIETGAFNGLPWKEQRRVSLHILRDLGLGKSHLEDLLQEEIQDLLQNCENNGGKPSILRTLLAPSMSNNIAALTYGTRLKYDDPVRKMLDQSINAISAEAGQVAWNVYFPGVAKLLKFFNFHKELAKFDEISKKFKKYTQDQIEDHEKTLDKSNIRDYIDGYLLEINKRNEAAFSKPVLSDMVGSFFAAGSETVRITIEWLMITMAAYTDVQEKVFSEIEKVIGGDRMPCWNDHLNMPYTEATIMELMRWKTIVPLNLLHYTLWDTEINGYFIPKHNYILSNLWDVHHNPQYWGQDAEEFRVSRFLTEDGKQLKKSEYFIPFSIGKRQCPGESFAKMEVFLYFVSLIQRFKVSLPPGKTANFNSILGISLLPDPQELCLIKRNK